MKKLSFILLGIFLVAFSSCKKDRIAGEGPVISETRNVGNFAGIDLRSVGDVFFKQDANYKVEVLAQPNIQNLIETYVSNNQLVVKLKNNTRLSAHEPIRIMVSAPNLTKLRISGSGDINTVGPLNIGSIDMGVSGSGSIGVAELTTGFIDAQISGSGSIVAYGTGTESKLRISGSGSIDMAEVAVTKATTTTSGSGDIKVDASQQLNITISGSGSVLYKGNPIINSSTSGSGKVQHL